MKPIRNTTYYWYIHNLKNSISYPNYTRYKDKKKVFYDKIKCFSIFKCLGIRAPEDTWTSLMFAPIHRTATFAILTSAGMLGGWLHSQDRLGYAAMTNTSDISQILKVTSHSHFTFSMVGRASALPWYPAGPQRLRPDLHVHGRCDCGEMWRTLIDS